MLELQGIAVSPGVAIGKVLILDQEGYRITRSQIDSSDRNNEAQRLRQAIDEASSRLDEHRQQSAEKLGKKVGAIFSAHQQMLLDPSLQSEWLRLIDKECYSAEYAISSVLNRYAQAFRNMGSGMMSERCRRHTRRRTHSARSPRRPTDSGQRRRRPNRSLPVMT